MRPKVAMKTYVWVVTDDQSIRRLDRDDPRLDWSWPHSPSGKVRMRGKGRWSYVPWGVCAEDAVSRYNARNMERIATLEAEIAEIRAQLLVVPVPEGPR